MGMEFRDHYYYSVLVMFMLSIIWRIGHCGNLRKFVHTSIHIHFTFNWLYDDESRCDTAPYCNIIAYFDCLFDCKHVYYSLQPSGISILHLRQLANLLDNIIQCSSILSIFRIGNWIEQVEREIWMVTRKIK